MNIFKEYTENQKRAKEKIKREKDADKEKHDRMMDSARTRDTRRKNSMTESEIHVRLDHLDGDSRQKKAGAVMRKHERAGHIEYVGNTDKGVVFKAKSKSHADRLHRELKPHATGVEHMSEAKSAQDPDIKDREGTQPAAYHKGLKKTTKAKRDAHFKKHGKKADNDASAYKDAPGDKKARKGDMPKSKYTKFVDNMMKEGTDFAAHRAAKATAPSDSDRKKMAKVADLMRKEREKKAAMKEGTASRWKAQDAAAASYSKEKRKPEPNPKIAALNKQLSARLKKEREQKAAMKKEEFDQFDEAIKKTPLGPKGQAAKAHITALGKKHGRSFGDQRLHIYHYPNKYDKKTNDHAKVLDRHQFGNKTEETQIDELSKKTMGSYVKKASQSAADHGMQAGRKQAERDEVDRSVNRHGNVDKDAVHKAFKTTHHDVKKPEMKAAKRLKGINRAIGKLTKEEMQHHNVLVHNPKDPRDHVVVKTKALNKSDAMKKVKAQYDNKKYKFAHHVEKTQNESVYKGMDAFGRGVIAKSRGGKAGAYISKKAKERSDMNKKNDPSMAKRGYALNVVDKDKAMKKAKKRGLRPAHPTTNYSKRPLPGGKKAEMLKRAKYWKEEKQKKDHQTISYVTHGGQKGKVQVHKDNAFKALNHYRKNNKSAQFEAMSPEARKAHGRMFKAAAKRKYDADTKAAAQAEREKRLKAKGWVKNDRGGMSKVSEEADKSLAAKAAKSGISVGTLKKVYNRGVAAWKTGHRPGTTPSQWGHARVNAFITKKKKGGLNHDKDLA